MTTDTKSFLFAMPDLGGNTPPQLSVARALVERGHDVRVLADRVLAPDVEATGAEHVPWTTAPQRANLEPGSILIRDWEARTPPGAFAMGRDNVMIGPAEAYARDTLAELDRRGADVVTADLFLLGVHLAAEAANVPLALLPANVMALPGWGVPAMGPGFQPARGLPGRARDRLFDTLFRRLFDKGLEDLNVARTALGLPRATSVLGQIERADRVIILTSRAFEFDAFSPPPNVVFGGPRLDDPAWCEPWTPPPGDDPLVLVGLSSTYMQQLPVLRRIAAALGTLPVRGVITTGPVIDPASIDAPANVTVVRSAPHAEVLRHAAAVITHAGHGTLIKALAAGVPVVALPMGRDQLDNAARAVAAGAGVRLRPGARSAALAGALRKVLGDPSYRAAAQRMATAISEELLEDRAVAELERLAVRDGAPEPSAVAGR
jgi:MGT family glycosyltransferase